MCVCGRSATGSCSYLTREQPHSPASQQRVRRFAHAGVVVQLWCSRSGWNQLKHRNNFGEEKTSYIFQCVASLCQRSRWKQFAVKRWPACSRSVPRCRDCEALKTQTGTRANEREMNLFPLDSHQLLHTLHHPHSTTPASAPVGNSHAAVLCYGSDRIEEKKKEREKCGAT